MTVFFNNQLLRGNRTVKKDAGAFNAFETPNLRPLAELEINITVNWSAVFKPNSLSKMNASISLCPHVGLLRFFPSITAENVSLV